MIEGVLVGDELTRALPANSRISLSGNLTV
jgi:hypothetical protein